jgi:hypothetical protein
MFILDNDILFPLLTYLFLFSFLVCASLIAKTYFKTVSLWVAAKAVTFNYKFLLTGAVLPVLIFGCIVALLFSGPAAILSAMPILIMSVLCMFTLATMLVTASAMYANIVKQSDRVLEVKYIIAAALFLFIIQVLPYIGFIFMYVIFSYTFGILSTYFWYSITKS